MNFTRCFHCYVGKKGSGKTTSMIDDFCQILGKTEMQLVGNAPLIFPELTSYMADNYDWHGAMDTRITLLESRAHLRRFFHFWGQGWTIPVLNKEQWKAGLRPDWRIAYRWLPTPIDDHNPRLPVDEMTVAEIKAAVNEGTMEAKPTKELPPVAFFIDEIARIYPAREFLDFVPALEDYLDQQRKFGHEIIASTVRLEKIDKAVRDMVDEWHVCVNWGKKRKSLFRLPAVLTQAEFDTPPSKGVAPQHTTFRRLDLDGLCKVYDTSAGVGIEGGMEADKGTKPKGLNWYWAAAAAVVILILALNSIKIFRWGAQKVLGKTPTPAIAMAIPEPTAEPQSPEPLKITTAAADLMGLKRPEATDKEADKKKEPEKRLTGLIITPDRKNVVAYFSDGDQVTPTDPRWRKLLKRGNKPAGIETTEGIFWLKTDPTLANVSAPSGQF